MTYFKGENLAFLAIDPPGNNERNPQSELSLERSDFLARYYALARHFIARGSDRHTQTHDGFDFEVCRVPEVDLWIGLRADLLAGEPPEYTKALKIPFPQPSQ
jgi:hypothetical protein